MLLGTSSSYRLNNLLFSFFAFRLYAFPGDEQIEKIKYKSKKFKYKMSLLAEELR
jgi:hypothetical protein